MTFKYDYIIVGSGLFGATFAYEAKKANKKVLVLEKRNHIGGNCYTEEINGINVHKYGPHIFHTNDKYIWDYVQQFAEFNNFILRTKVRHGNEIFSFPINLFTLYQLWGVSTPANAQKKLDSVKINIDDPQNLEEWILSQVGEEIYHKFIKGYTKKQWGQNPKSLPSSIIKRLPIRLTFDDNYFNDKYQGIPVGGYTQIFNKMLKDIEVSNIDFFSDKEYFEKIAKKIVYTGKIDELFEYRHGKLDYRSLRFDHQIIDGDFQGNAIINYTSENVPFTRITEHKHFEFKNSPTSVISKEYPEIHNENNIPYYPINDEKNTYLYNKYSLDANTLDNYIFGGRLAKYKYFDMHQIIGSALGIFRKNIC